VAACVQDAVLGIRKMPKYGQPMDGNGKLGRTNGDRKGRSRIPSILEASPSEA
jgi:hypothetical protein